MTFSVDLVFLIANLLLLAFSYGKFSQKMSNLDDMLKEIKNSLNNNDIKYYSKIDGEKLEQAYKDLFNRVMAMP